MDLKPPEPAWFAVSNSAEVPSPSLLVYPERVEENLRRMLAAVGEPERLRPHMKTHKMPEVIRMHLKQGITKFKCATIAEAEMTAGAGAQEVLLAYPPVAEGKRRQRQSSIQLACLPASARLSISSRLSGWSALY